MFYNPGAWFLVCSDSWVKLKSTYFCKEIIEALTALVGRLSLSVGWENGPEW